MSLSGGKLLRRSCRDSSILVVAQVSETMTLLKQWEQLSSINAGGHGLIVGRKAFQKPMNEGVELIQAIQDVYLDKNIAIV